MTSPSIEYVFPSNVNLGIVAMKLRARLATDDASRSLVRMQEAISRAGRLRLYFDIADYDGIELRALWEQLKAAASTFTALERVAVLGDQRWAQLWSRFMDPITPFEIRRFASEARDEAVRWINEGLDA